MRASPFVTLILILSVLALLGGSILFAAFMHEPTARATGAGLVLFGAVGLWYGMRRLPGGPK